MNHSQIAEVIRSKLFSDLGIWFVDLESGEPRPQMPFISRKFTSPYIPQPTSETHEYNGTNVTLKQSSQPKMTLSLTIYADNKDEALEVAMQLKEWFDFVAREYLSDNGIVVVNIENVEDRTVLLETDYEHRCGFDVQVRVKHEVTTTTEYIETVNINGEVV